MKQYEIYLMELGLVRFKEKVPTCEILDDETGEECSKIDMSIGQKIADALGLHFEGFQKVKHIWGWVFSDPDSGSTFMAKDEREAKEALSRVRNRFGLKVA